MIHIYIYMYIIYIKYKSARSPSRPSALPPVRPPARKLACWRTCPPARPPIDHSWIACDTTTVRKIGAHLTSYNDSATTPRRSRDSAILSHKK